MFLAPSERRPKVAVPEGRGTNLDLTCFFFEREREKTQRDRFNFFLSLLRSVINSFRGLLYSQIPLAPPYSPPLNSRNEQKIVRRVGFEPTPLSRADSAAHFLTPGGQVLAYHFKFVLDPIGHCFFLYDLLWPHFSSLGIASTIIFTEESMIYRTIFTIMRVWREKNSDPGLRASDRWEEGEKEKEWRVDLTSKYHFFTLIFPHCSVFLRIISHEGQELTSERVVETMMERGIDRVSAWKR